MKAEVPPEPSSPQPPAHARPCFRLLRGLPKQGVPALTWQASVETQQADNIMMRALKDKCKPRFSTLRNHTRLLRDRAAQAFWQVRDAISELQPVCVCLENVPGIPRVLDQVKDALSKCGEYWLAVLPIDPASLGAPIARRATNLVRAHATGKTGLYGIELVEATIQRRRRNYLLW